MAVLPLEERRLEVSRLPEQVASRVRGGHRLSDQSTKPDTIDTRRPVTTRPVLELEPLSCFRLSAPPADEKCKISSVMTTFWRVKKKFSPYVENGNRLREAYASEMAYEAVSRI